MGSSLLLMLRAGRHLQQQQVPGILLLRSFTSNSTKEAVEKAVIVDTLAQVAAGQCWCHAALLDPARC